MSTPRISVIMAMHDAAGTVEEALRSLRANTERSWEALVINDASTDESAEIVRRLSAEDARIVLVEQTRGGPGAARNRGLDIARGEFIAFLDADDWVEPRALEWLLAAAQETGAACGRSRMCDPTGAPMRWPEPVGVGGPPIGVDTLVHGECFAIHAQLVKRSLVGGTRFRTDLSCCEDLDFFLALAEKGVRWVREPHLVCSYRLRARERGTRAYAAKFNEIREILGPLAPSPESMGARAFRYAMMMVLQDATLDHAASVLSGLPARARITAEQAAVAAHFYLPLSEESGMDAWQMNLDRYASRVGAWWARCIREGWLDAGAPGEAIGLLAHLIANELDVPADLADDLTPDPDRPIVLLGLGINGRRMAQELQGRGVSFSVRDDALTARELSELFPGAVLIPSGAPFVWDAQYVMTLLDDERFMAKLPRGLDVLRWSERVRGMAMGVRSRLEAHLIPKARRLSPPMNVKRPVHLFLGSFKRPEKLAAMIESVRDSGYPARVFVAAGDVGTIATCERYSEIAECVYNTENNRKIGCTAPLNHVYKSLVRADALFCTDDCIFDKDALAIAMETLYTRFPDGDGVVGLKQENIPDGYDLAFPLMGRKFLDRFAPAGSGKDLFFPGFYHLFNDAEIGITIKCLGNWVFEPRATIRHLHPAHGGTLDKTHNHGLTYRQHDEALWRARRAKGLIWGVDA